MPLRRTEIVRSREGSCPRVSNSRAPARESPEPTHAMHFEYCLPHPPAKTTLTSMNRLAVLLAVALSLTSFTRAADAAFKAGAATSNITPPLSSKIVGGFLPFPSTGVHDE